MVVVHDLRIPDDQAGARRLADGLAARVKIGQAAATVVDEIEAQAGRCGVVHRDAERVIRGSETLHRTTGIEPPQNVVADLRVVGGDLEGFALLIFGAVIVLAVASNRTGGIVSGFSSLEA